MKEYISSKSNEKIKTVRKLSDKKYRTEYSSFVIEGHKLVSEYLDSGLMPDSVFLTGQAEEKYCSLVNKLSNVKTYVVTKELYDYISSEQAPQGILAVCQLPDRAGTITNGPSIILESVRDAGNIGTVIRTAVALGISNIVISSDCADLYNSKTIRATMGALFKANIVIDNDLISTVKKLRAEGRKVYAAMPNSESKNICDMVFRHNDCIVVGNEGNGITKELSEACDGTVTIPMTEDAESLNASVAASILMWELVRGKNDA